MAAITQLSPAGLSMMPYGSFSGKVPITPSLRQLAFVFYITQSLNNVFYNTMQMSYIMYINQENEGVFSI